MLKDYATRVDATYELLRSILETVNADHQSLRQAVRASDEEARKGFENSFPIKFDMTNKSSETVHFFGYKQKIEKSDISGGDWIVYSKEPFEADIPRYDESKTTKSVVPPKAYLIPQQWSTVISRLKMHGVKLERLKSSAELDIESYRFSNVKFQQNPFEGHHPVSYSVETVKEKRAFPAGTVVVKLNQRAARVAINALEPEAPDAFVAWGFFDAIFEQKEYAEDYVMEKVAREMIAKDPQLKAEFESKVQADTAFANNPGARLNFFYQHSPYWDHQVNLYPIARMMQDEVLKTESFK